MISYAPLWETMEQCGATTYTLQVKGGISSSTIRPSEGWRFGLYKLFGYAVQNSELHDFRHYGTPARYNGIGNGEASRKPEKSKGLLQMFFASATASFFIADFFT